MLGKTKQLIYALLRKSERLTGTDMVYLAKGGFWLSLNKVINSTTALLLAIAYANLLDKNDYGLYKYVLSIAGMLTIFSLPGITKALSRSVSLGYEGSVFTAIKTKFKWSLAGGALSIIISLYYFYNKNTTLAIAFLIVALFSSLINGLIVHGSYLQGKKQFKPLSLFSSISQIFNAAAIIGILLFKKNIILLILISYLSALLIQGIISVYVYKKYKPNKQKDLKMVGYAKHLSLMNVLVPIANQIDKIIMWHYLGPSQLAIYSFSIIPINQIKSFLSSINILAFPKLATQNNKNLKKTLTKKILLFTISLIIPILIYILLAPYLFKLIFPQYLESIIFTQVFALSLLLFPFSVIASLLTAKARKKPLYILKIVSPAIKIILMVALIPLFGVWGAIITLLLSNIINKTILIYFLKKL